MDIKYQIKNLEEFEQLLKKAQVQVSSLKETLKAIDDFEFETK